MAENDIIALKELAGESYQEIALTASDLKLGTTSGLPIKTGNGGVLEASSFGTSAGTFCEGNDARLSDARTPTSHAASHLPSGADELFDQSLNTTSIVTFETVTTADVYTGNFSLRDNGSNKYGTFIASDLLSADRQYSLPNASGTLALQGAITTSGFTAGNHKVFYSNGSGQITELPLGAANTVLTSQGTTSAPTFATVSGGVSAVDSTTADVFSVSGSNLVADDPAKEDAFIMWDESAGKLVHSAVLESIQPDQLPNLSVWLDANATYITKDNSDNVSSWTDRAGVSNFSQNTAARQPKWFAGTDATHSINSLPAVWFDGDNATVGNRDFMTRAAHLDLPTDFTLFVVGRLDATDTTRTKLFLGDINSADQNAQYLFYWNRGVSAPNGYGIGAGRSAVFDVFGMGTSATGVSLLSARRHGRRSYSMKRNGSQLEFTNAATINEIVTPRASDCGTTSLGRSGSVDGGYFGGDIAELIVYSSALNSDQINGVERYLATKYNITLA